MLARQQTLFLDVKKRTHSTISSANFKSQVYAFWKLIRSKATRFVQIIAFLRLLISTPKSFVQGFYSIKMITSISPYSHE
jgi:hypothetical protein